jgi:hypothetical protein
MRASGPGWFRAFSAGGGFELLNDYAETLAAPLPFSRFGTIENPERPARRFLISSLFRPLVDAARDFHALVRQPPHDGGAA